MVVFICNACGNSIKKNKVEKHYQTECPNCSVLSCIDCGKDFVGDAYQQHTTCISEAEKYQGKLFKDSDRGKPSKGEQKQQDWTQRIQEIAADKRASGDPKIAQLLETIATYHNVPRKKAKFENFVSNSLNVHKAHILGQLWEAFADAAKQQTSGGSERSGTEEEGASDHEKMTSAAQGEEGEGDDKRKKIKRKHKAEEGGDKDEGTEGSGGADCTGDVGPSEPESHTSPPPTKKKKKKSKGKESEPLALDLEVGNVDADGKDCSMDTDVPPVSGADSGLPHPKKKKKKTKHTEDKKTDAVGPALEVCGEGGDGGEGGEAETLATANEQESSTKSKKKKGKKSATAEEATVKEVEESAVEGCEDPLATEDGPSSSTKAGKKRRRGKAVEGEGSSSVRESASSGMVAEDVEVDDQSDLNAVAIATEGMKQAQVDKTENAGGDSPEQKHKKKKKKDKTKEIKIELVDLAVSSPLAAAAKRMKVADTEQEVEVAGSSTKKRKSKKLHKKEDAASV